jgi:nucleotide-binding universal stress UspA family protein
MINKILLPTDFSHTSMSAFKFAEDFANQSNSEIHLLHIVETPSGSYGGSFNTEGEVDHASSPEDLIFTKSLMGSVNKKIHAMKDQARHKHVEFHAHVELGSPFKSIRNYSDHRKIDLMIVGSKGTHNMGEEIVGSNAERLVRHSKMPVIVVKSYEGELSMRNIVLASEFNEDLSSIVPIIKEVQRLFGSNIHLLRVNTPNDFHTSRTMKKMMNDFVKKHNLDNTTVNIYSDIIEEDGIIYFADEINADMIMIPTHGRKGLMHLLSGSVAEDVVNHSKRPVMTFKI